MEDLSKARQISPEEIEKMRKDFKAAEIVMDELIQHNKTKLNESNNGLDIELDKGA